MDIMVGNLLSEQLSITKILVSESENLGENIIHHVTYIQTKKKRHAKSKTSKTSTLSSKAGVYPFHFVILFFYYS